MRWHFAWIAALLLTACTTSQPVGRPDLIEPTPPLDTRIGGPL